MNESGPVKVGTLTPAVFVKCGKRKSTIENCSEVDSHVLQISNNACKKMKKEDSESNFAPGQLWGKENSPRKEFQALSPEKLDSNLVFDDFDDAAFEEHFKFAEQYEAESSARVSKKMKMEDSEAKTSSNFACEQLAKEQLPAKDLPALSLEKAVSSEKLNSNFTFEDLDEAAFEEHFELAERYEAENLAFNEPKRCKIIGLQKHNQRTKLEVMCSKTEVHGTCYIEGFWINNEFAIGDVICVHAIKTLGEWVVNNDAGCVVYEPDALISCTSVAGAVFCKRKSVLSERYAGFEPSNRAMLIGIFVHTLLQSVLKNRLNSLQEIEAKMKTIINSENSLRRFYETGISVSEIEAELSKLLPNIAKFVHQYVENNSERTSDNWKGRITGITDIEENIWCPQLGIKGKIDVTVEAEVGLMPLELKTGRATASLEHRGQLMLYAMMMERLGHKVSSGLLLYLREGVLKEVSVAQREKRDLIILRNELAYYLRRRVKKSSLGNNLEPPELPAPINHPAACRKCAYNTICSSYLKVENYDLSKNKQFAEVAASATCHLSEVHLEYFLHWSALIMKEGESQMGRKNLHEIYTVEAKEREKSGRCIINLEVMAVELECNGLFKHIFGKESSTSSFLNSGLADNNYVIVSTDDRPAVAAGFVTNICSNRITLALERNLRLKYSNKRFHLDTYDSYNSQSFNLTSLALLLEPTPRATELRKIIIDRTPVSFLQKLPSIIAKVGTPILRRLNRVQQRAVLKALAAKDFLLIKGMPGSGKTATIVALTELLVKLGKTVLLTSHTHSAIDNVCIRLKSFGVDFIRLGSETRIDDNIKSFSESNKTKHCTSPELLEEVYNSFKVVAVTCMGAGHPLLSKRSFDICIVDESTQVLQTSVLRPLYASKTFVLVGDPDQLPPVIKNREASDAGMSESLFERLQHLDAEVTLNLNYRMNKTITALANALTYKGELLVANDLVSNRTLEIPNFKVLESEYQENWIMKALNPSLESAVQVIDSGQNWCRLQSSSTDSVFNSDNQSCVNEHEAAIVVALVEALLKGGVSNSDIGVIATYTSQVTLISSLLQHTNVDISTVDRFQGRDKNVVIYSATKSKDMSKCSTDLKLELLEDKRRLTVAVTRAKCKLIIIGDLSTIEKYSTFATLLKSLDSNQVLRVTQL